MGISNKIRKLLWGRSGNRCAICRTELIKYSTPTNDESVIGDECHIISRERNGPRHDPNFPDDELDLYNNLILLCRVHHKMVDDQEETYTAEKLREIKTRHEKWVSDKLRKSADIKGPVIKRIKGNIPEYLIRLTTGKELLNILTNAYAFDFDHDELETDDEVSLVAGFLQNAQDWADIGLELESGDRVRISHTFSQEIQELKDSGFWVFGGREIRILEVNSEPSNWPVAILRVIRSTNPAIIHMKFESDKN